jgi:hypothetical protein
MKQPQQRVLVNGKAYLVSERSGYLKASLNGYFGWTSVWADTETGLQRRIKQVRSGGQ